jgi:diaminopimelate epimerase
MTSGARILAFEKWEGLGNDFIVVDGPPPPAEAVRALCDRRRGVGADGVLAIEPADGAAARMTVVNADGSRPEMCGNGLRCVAGWLVDRGRAPVGAWAVAATDAGSRPFLVERAADGFDVAIRMGEASFDGELAAVVEGERLAFDRVSMGNPHAIRFGAYDEEDLARIGPQVTGLPPGGTNVELVRGEGVHLDVLVWERGVGPTAACGTGACAVAAAACRSGRSPFGVPLEVVLPGGALSIEVAPGSFAVTMRGPARRAFCGEVATTATARAVEAI